VILKYLYLSHSYKLGMKNENFVFIDQQMNATCQMNLWKGLSKRAPLNPFIAFGPIWTFWTQIFNGSNFEFMLFQVVGNQWKGVDYKALGIIVGYQG
jgi:hypothetical protein